MSVKITPRHLAQNDENWKLGAKAYRAGVALQANPYRKEHPKHAAWARGWNGARELKAQRAAMPKVLNKYKNPSLDAVYIGRGSPWGNPFVIGRDGDRDAVCDKYEKMVEANHAYKDRVIEVLRGKNLMCFCAPLRCHGDYLLRIANQPEEEENGN